MKKSVESLKEEDLSGKRVLVRVDMNVPMDRNGNITDDTRIRDAIPTIKYLIEHRARVILMARLGLPVGDIKNYSLKSLVPRLSELLGFQVMMANDCIGAEVENLVNALPEGGVLLLENLRLYKEEIFNDKNFASKLAYPADLYVNEAFGTSHRSYASTEGVASLLKPAVAGLLMRKELDYFVGVLEDPPKPFLAIVGGSKLSTKSLLIKSLMDKKVDTLLLGGGIIFTLLRAKGRCVGSSLVERHELNEAKSIMAYASAKNVRLLFPLDVMMADKHGAEAMTKVVRVTKIPNDDWMGLDIGPEAIKIYSETLDAAKTIFWNGPMGVYEYDKFAAGTKAIAEKLAELTEKGVTTIIAGGDSVAAVKKFGLADKMSLISTGRGASLELLKGKQLPGLVYLDAEE
ncbi:phosphoglycerate kinase, cytosolic-like [Lycium ferocissimum]|uniref:phosphoglycerate kinase, cytosolic-like n=1 Tax=Lycium ferocissimum TaxID=112874 RepID=UPI002814982C|nr:phosphoglycerate kinase, cytosolic-like [Lycium ferocissimum]